MAFEVHLADFANVLFWLFVCSRCQCEWWSLFPEHSHTGQALCQALYVHDGDMQGSCGTCAFRALQTAQAGNLPLLPLQLPIAQHTLVVVRVSHSDQGRIWSPLTLAQQALFLIPVQILLLGSACGCGRNKQHLPPSPPTKHTHIHTSMGRDPNYHNCCESCSQDWSCCSVTRELWWSFSVEP